MNDLDNVIDNGEWSLGRFVFTEDDGVGKVSCAVKREASQATLGKLIEILQAGDPEAELELVRISWTEMARGEELAAWREATAAAEAERQAARDDLDKTQLVGILARQGVLESERLGKARSADPGDTEPGKPPEIYTLFGKPLLGAWSRQHESVKQAWINLAYEVSERTDL